ncbi:glycine/betaine ABC transporter substrate-binding protein [Bacillus sp. SA1-12]|uniref:glycine betaine ABC transporter substrate-binding protein n=1 Tax=Bacillus sp. SA1-12 TaxID=1455638 RepID=UPI000626F793|nr:glycine betaine ABC transporter substrate-binding protein [Bacillus sp. SA1-12]KKI90740.1 glycine/betaine ABC transporter substrate-binding protein [Bacillus sp. SA1-12]
MKKLTVFAASLLLVFSLAGCAGGKTVTVGTQTFTETKILGYMYEYLIEDKTDIDVDVKTDLASSPFVLNAMKENQLQIGTLYSGEIFNKHFPIEETKDPEKVLEQAQNGFDKYMGMAWFDPLGFENTYAFTVRKEVAEAYNLKKISDLKNVASKMTLGVDTAWLEREHDGYDAFSKHYGLKFKNVYPMEINLVYKAVEKKQMDIVLAYSSDARIKEYDLVTLEDDKRFFPPYDASTVVLNDTIKKYPKIKSALKPLEGTINLDTMRALNAKVDIEKQAPKDVAKQFLEEQGLLKR